MSARRSRWWSAETADGRAGRRRGRRRRLRGAHAGGRPARGRARRRAASLAGGAGQYRGRLAGPGDRSRRQCAARSTHHRSPPSTSRGSRWSISASRSPRWSRAAPPRATIRRTTAISLRVCSQGARAMRDGIAGIMGVPDRAPARRHRGCRRRLRAEDRALSGIPRDAGRRASKIGRPVHWMSSRAEAFLSDNHARDTYSEVELALDERGKFLALRIRHLGSMGAYHRRGRRQHPDRELHALPARHVRHPADRHRRALRVHQHDDRPRPIAAPGVRRRTTCLERVVDEAARVTGIDPIKLRRRNLIRVGDAVQDRGRHHLSTAAISRPCSTRRWRSPTTTVSSSAGARPRKRGKYRGFGISCMLEHAGGLPLEGDRAELSRRRARSCSASTCSRPARATPRCSPHAGRTARHQAGADRAPARRLRAWRSRAMPRSARAPR